MPDELRGVELRLEQRRVEEPDALSLERGVQRRFGLEDADLNLDLGPLGSLL